MSLRRSVTSAVGLCLQWRYRTGVWLAATVVFDNARDGSTSGWEARSLALRPPRSTRPVLSLNASPRNGGRRCPRRMLRLCDGSSVRSNRVTSSLSFATRRYRRRSRRRVHRTSRLASSACSFGPMSGGTPIRASTVSGPRGRLMQPWETTTLSRGRDRCRRWPRCSAHPRSRSPKGREQRGYGSWGPGVAEFARARSLAGDLRGPSKGLAAAGLPE